MANIKLIIDGKSIETAPGKTILEAATENGIEIPVFCYHYRLKSVGACRICVVEIEKWAKLQVSCATAAADGMIVHTNSPRVIKARQGVLEFILANHPLDCPTCDKGGECPLQDITFKYGLDFSRFQEQKRRFIVDENSTFDDLRIGPEIIRNQNRCIHCFRCTRLVTEAFFENDLGYYERGANTEILPPPGGEIRNLYSGNVVEYCPVGALTNTDWRYKIRVWNTLEKATICRYCSDGCNLRVSVSRQKIYRAQSRRNDFIDEGLPCDLGRYGYQFVHHDDRLTKPMMKMEGELVECSWETALGTIKGKLEKTIANLGPQGVSCLTGEALSNEDYFVIGRFFRSLVGTNSIDHRISRKKRLTFSDEVRRRELHENKLEISDLDQAQLFFLLGTDLHSENPITALRVLKARRQHEAKLILANPRPTQIGRAADLEMIYKPYSELFLLQGLARIIVERKLADPEKVKIPENQIEAFLKETSLFNPQSVAEITGIKVNILAEMARMICHSGRTIFIVGEIVRAHYQRDALLIALYNLARLTGNLKGDSSGILFPGGEANSFGADLLGMLPDRLPFNAPVDKLASLWGKTISNIPGLDAIDILQKVEEEQVECGFVIGTDIVSCYPDSKYISSTLARLNFLVVADLFMTDTARLADIVLPLASHLESEGTFYNWEGRLQKFEKAIDNLGQSLSAWQIFTRLSSKWEKDFGYKCGADIFREIARLSDYPHIREFKDIPSTGWMSKKSKSYPEIELTCVQYKEPALEKLPLVLLSGSGDHHFGRGITAHCESLNRFLADPYVAIGPEAANELSITDGDLVKLENASGKIVAKALIVQHLPPEVVFVPDNFPEVKANLLRSRDYDIDRVKLVRM